METPTKASDLTEVYKGKRDIKDIAIKAGLLRMSGDGFFTTLQGEGPTLGYPAVFARLHHCNLACTWCDAFYTWNKDSEEFWTESWPAAYQYVVDQLEDQWMESVGTMQERRVVWTGGEPLMQKTQIDAVMQLLWSSGAPFWHPEIETNGTIMPTQLQLDNYQFNVSPKIPSSGNGTAKALKPKVIRAINKVNSTFKFVCSNEDDLWQVEFYYGDLIDQNKILIMPEGVTEEFITPNARVLAPLVLSRGWRMTPRFQAIAYDGAARGV
jgi:7-carboxy-7-deazaguanine synthase